MTAAGILNVNKEKGITSHDVVQRVRRALPGTKVGHAGTLDPMATGVLVVLVGHAVRISEFVMDLTKVYRATITLGESTDTYDAEGNVTATAPVLASESDVLSSLSRFVGEIEQTPPPYSAAKIDGKRAYKLARQGKSTLPPARIAHVYRVELTRFNSPYVEIEVECAKGTYIRSIGHDLGIALGCGAHVSTLIRTQIGPFDMESAVDSATLPEVLQDEGWKSLLRPTDLGLANLPSLTVQIEDEKDLRHGQAVEAGSVNLPSETAVSDGLTARGYAEDGSLIGILQYDQPSKTWRPRKILT
ncbi:MAG: tRNA pseudouridine(55) synthase TruB [Chloroflexi bacterium]|nr:tRNA pseudouridine(55) synthase TruB [Chloroflexota bacterium]